MVQDECRKCFDIGVIRVLPTDGSIETLMLCDCHEGKNQRYALPRWEWKYGQLYRRERCPTDWFKPEVVVIAPSGDMKLKESIQHKIAYWKAKVSIAESYWEQAKTDSVGYE